MPSPVLVLKNKGREKYTG